mmetsp:Transcript_174302/g.558737  ORF Transcript_174302/g.558737 Transcript_174302/m.558737 type:complete len:221 (+) Transcript_174302:96-758(+)
MSDGTWEHLLSHHSFLKVLQEFNKADPRTSAQIEKEEAERLLSLRISQDKRFKQMDYFRTNASACGHFGHLQGEEETRLNETSTFEDIVKREAANIERQDKKKAQVGGIDERKEWQDALDQKVRQLMIDFDLTDVPSSRLAHLDRMHSWFTDHGARQVRKVVQGPNYLTAQRDETLPPGSTKHIQPPSGTSLQLAGVYAMKSPRPDASPKSSQSSPSSAR